MRVVGSLGMLKWIRGTENISISARKVLQFLILFVCIFVFLTANNTRPLKGSVDEVLRLQFIQSVQDILQKTPYLWRRFDTSNDTSRSRIQSQRDWISSFSQTNYSSFTQNKIILVQNRLSSIYCTQGKMNCPYAPNFEDACKIVQETYKDIFVDTLKYSKVDAVVSKSIWIPQLYEYHIPSHVLSVKYILEPPHITKKVHLGRNNAILASYWKGSDIPIPYGMWVNKDGALSSYEPISCSTGTTDNINMSRISSLRPSKTSGIVAAVISNCDDVNGRLSFITELQKFIPVDVYGKCGTRDCPGPTSKGNSNFVCMKHIEENYKFYLAFENSNCVDYITEKLFINVLKHAVVPVVMGARKQDYLDTGLLSNSFIHVDDFDSPKSLAKYLLSVNENDKLYNAYLEGRGDGSVTDSGWQDFFCRLCGMLYYSEYVPRPTWKSDALWETTNKCFSRNQSSWTQSS